MSTAEVAEFVARQAVPATVRDRARWAFLDTVGVMLAGADTPAARAATWTARRSPGPVRLFAGGTASPGPAAMANAVAASALDFDDGHYRGGGVHAGSTVVPVLLALAGPGTRLDDLLDAQVIGYEVAIRAGYRLARAGGPYRASGAVSAIGAAAAAARLTGLPPDDTLRVLRIAAAHAPTATLQLPMVKESIGWAAQTAVTALHLVQDSFDAGPLVERALGLPATVFDGSSPDDLDNDGRLWASVGCYVKPYPCCRAIHAALDVLSTLRAAHPGPVKHILVETTPGAASLTDPAPATLEAAQFSIPAAAAALLLDPDHPRTGLGSPATWFADLADPAHLDLARRVTVRAADDLPDQGLGYPARVTLTTAEGSVTAEARTARGSTTTPLTEAELTTKLTLTAGPLAPALLPAVLDPATATAPSLLFA